MNYFNFVKQSTASATDSLFFQELHSVFNSILSKDICEFLKIVFFLIFLEFKIIWKLLK